jgi:Protein of unknown function (DUF4030)
MDNLFKDFKNRVESTEFPDVRLEKAMKTAIRSAKSKRRKGTMKLMYLTSAATLFACLLLGSVFVSPTLADTFAKIPVIGSLFEQEDPAELIVNALNEEGYKVESFGFQYQPEKVAQIFIDGSDDYIQEIQDEVKDIAKDILRSQGYDAYSVKVEGIKDDIEITEDRSGAVDMKFVSIENMPEYKQKWISSKALSYVSQELYSKKGYHVEGIATTMEEGTMKWHITLSLTSENPSVKKIAKGIEDNINTILHSENIHPKIDGLPYQITISTADNKTITNSNN